MRMLRYDMVDRKLATSHLEFVTQFWKISHILPSNSQGTVLGPILSLIFKNDLQVECICLSTLRLFVDDCTSIKQDN